MSLYCILAGFLLVGSYVYCGATTTLEQRVKSLEKFKEEVKNELEFGGKRYQTISYNSKLL